ncbi:MAG TPA: Ig-like domain-containing protein [Candidatus Paceibacterota bacterium]|nr:Ig-like domain-containing protein [Candidatus Paceibacterota bacterium]
MKAKTVKKTARRATKKPAVVKLAVKSTPKRAVRFSLVMIPMGVAALVIAFAVSLAWSPALTASAWGWHPHDPHTGDSLYEQCHNHLDDNQGHGIDLLDPACKDVKNAAPEALNQTLVTLEGQSTSTVLTGTDDDDDILYFTISNLPQHGTLMCGGSVCDDSGDVVIGSTIDGGTAPSVTYVPDAGYTGPDEFDFTASDGLLDNDATISITVTAPVVPPTPVCSQGVGSPLLVDATQHITGDPDSSVPGPNWANDTFTRHIQIWQETIGTDTHYCAEADDNGTFTTIGGASGISPQSGAALPEVVTGTMVGGTHGEIVGGTLMNTSNPIADVDCTTAPSGSCDSLTGAWVAYYFGAGATYNYSPSPADTTGNWGWTYTADCRTHGTWVNQNAGNSGDILAGNECSVVTAANQSVTTAFDTPIDITLAGTDSVSGPTLVFATSSSPSNGTLATTSDAATFTYMPTAGFAGADSFTFTVGDGMSTSTGTVSITVNAQDAGGNGGGSSSGNSNSTPSGGGGGGGVVISGPLSIGYVNTNTGGSSGSTGGSVLGASTETPASCSAYLTSYMGLGRRNDPDQVKKLQAFLNTELGLDLEVSGTFDTATWTAVNQFQLKYWDQILKPWVSFGLETDHTPTGYVYKTTLRQINNIECASLDLPQPQLP